MSVSGARLCTSGYLTSWQPLDPANPLKASSSIISNSLNANLHCTMLEISIGQAASAVLKARRKTLEICDAESTLLTGHG